MILVVGFLFWGLVIKWMSGWKASIWWGLLGPFGLVALMGTREPPRVRRSRRARRRLSARDRQFAHRH